MTYEPHSSWILARAGGAPFGGRGPVRFGPVRGAASGRDFDPTNAGGPVRVLSTDRIQITHRGVDVVERHVERFGPDPSNAGMVRRLHDIADGKIKPTKWDKNFYGHELREFVRYRRLGWPDGAPESPDAQLTLWNNTHTAALEDYGLNERLNSLYHPDWH